MPILASDIAMPPPIVPAPMTATRRIDRTGRSAGMSGIFAASRRANSTCAAASSRSASVGVEVSVVVMLRFSGAVAGGDERLGTPFDEFTQAFGRFRRTLHVGVEVFAEKPVVVRQVVDARQQVRDAPVGVGRVFRDYRGQLKR